MEDGAYLSKVCLCTHLGAHSLSGDKGHFLPPGPRERGRLNTTFTEGNLCPAYGQTKGGQRALPVSVDS